MMLNLNKGWADSLGRKSGKVKRAILSETSLRYCHVNSSLHAQNTWFTRESGLCGGWEMDKIEGQFQRCETNNYLVLFFWEIEFLST